MDSAYAVGSDVFSLDVNSNNSSYYDIRCPHKRVAHNAIHTMDFALELHGRLGHTRRSHNMAWRLRHACNGELIVPRL
jgi:hypothetical protein